MLVEFDPLRSHFNGDLFRVVSGDAIVREMSKGSEGEATANSDRELKRKAE